MDSRTVVTFQSTHPLRGATCAAGLTQAALAISIHAPLAGCDTSLALTLAVRMAFQSTHPLRGATLTTSVQMVRQRCQSTHPLRGATYGCGPEADWLQISIHAPLAGCDRSTSRRTHSPRNFNPRTPCGVRPGQPCATLDLHGFQSTHPLRGATQTHAVVDIVQIFQSTHPLRGATRVPIVFRSHRPISIHAPLAGCDTHRGCGFCER